jgi:hypothetical protein
MYSSLNPQGSGSVFEWVFEKVCGAILAQIMRVEKKEALMGLFFRVQRCPVRSVSELD